MYEITNKKITDFSKKGDRLISFDLFSFFLPLRKEKNNHISIHSQITNNYVLKSVKLDSPRITKRPLD